MIKKFSILLIVTILLFSCGKKGDPIYNQNNQDSKIFSIQKSTFS